MKFADLEFSDDGTPSSTAFADIYFSQGEGLNEKQHVFIHQNNLPERFRQLDEAASFTIAETGFGTGLNFLLAWHTFLENAPASVPLTFISCEKFPIQVSDLAQAQRYWPELTNLAEQLQANYPPALEGYHLLEFGQVNLLLMFGDAATTYSELSADVDAWFLDGFAPSKNPDMWRPELFKQLARLSHTNTTATTYTVARIVRDGLEGAGFELQKVTGYGRKRDMLYGNFVGIIGPLPLLNWPSSGLPRPKPNTAKKVAIIGAGIAGVSTAIELIKRGYQVEVFDKHPLPAQGGSGNRQGAVYAKLTAQPTVATAFYAQALLTAQKLLAQLPNTVDHAQCGLVQLVHDKRELKRLLEISASDFIPETVAMMKSAQELTELLGITVSDPGLWFANGGWLAPAQLIHYWIEKYAITCHLNTQVSALIHTKTGWQLQTECRQSWQFDQVILCNAFDAKHLTQTEHLPLNTIAGQVTQLEQTAQHQALKAVICTNRYAMPPLKGVFTIGSSFRIKSTSTEVTDADHLENVSQLSKRVPNLLTDNETVVNGRAAVRCNAPDYLPLVGAISNPDPFLSQFRIPMQRNLAHREPPATHWPGLWVNLAHGSKGLCSSHICAKLLAALINDEPLPMPIPVVQALNPNRFLVRELLREKRQKL